MTPRRASRTAPPGHSTTRGDGRTVNDAVRPRPSRWGASALADRSFRRLWFSGLVSDSGDWLLFIALPLVVLKLTGSALTTSLAFLLELVPAVLLAPVVARLVDRFDRRSLMVVVTLGQAVSLMPLLFVRSAADLPLVYLVIVLQASLSSIFEPAKNALLPQLVGPDRIVSANALVGLNQNLGRLVGGPLGGLLLVVGDLTLIVVVDACSYLVSALLVATIPRQKALAVLDDSPRAGVSALLFGRRFGPTFAVFFVASIAQGLFVVLFVFFVTDTLHGGDAEVGLLRGVQAVGAIAAGVTVGFAASRFRVRTLSLIGLGAFALLSLVTWNLPFASTDLRIYLLLFIIVGAPGVFLGDGMVSILQQQSRDVERGGVFTALGVSTAAGQAIGMIAAGLLQGQIHTVVLLEAQGLLYVLAFALAVIVLPRRAGAGGDQCDARP